MRVSCSSALTHTRLSRWPANAAVAIFELAVLAFRQRCVAEEPEAQLVSHLRGASVTALRLTAWALGRPLLFELGDPSPVVFKLSAVDFVADVKGFGDVMCNSPIRQSPSHLTSPPLYLNAM